MKQKRKGNARSIMNINVKITVLIFSFFFVLIAAKLAYVTLSEKVDGINLTEFADNRNTTKQTIYASRGSIFDVNGDELAKNVKSYTVIAFLSSSRTKNPDKPQHVVDVENTAKKLSPILNMTEESLIKLMSQDLYQVELGPGGRGITEDTKKTIEKLGLPGIGFTSSTKRFYMNKNYASYLIGYARRKDNGEISGEMGIEAYFDDILKGKNGYTEYQQDAYGYPMPNTQITEDAESGSDIYLTIDNNVQLILENVLTKLKNEHELDWAQFTVMDAKTGAIVGSATVPTFDLNTLEGIDSYLNPLTSYQYEPGSTMKIFSWMAAMEAGIYDGEKLYPSGTITLKDGTVIKDFNNYGWGDISFNTGFLYSSNVAATKLGLELGADRLRDFYSLCGFGSKTGISLPNEAEGSIQFHYESELANATFGQGMSVTPVQMLQALSALLNDGVMIKPYIISKIVDGHGNVTMEGSREEVRRIVSATTAGNMRKLMNDVIYHGLTSNIGYAPSNTTIAGKTGTAQIAASTGGYMTGYYDYIKSFAGFFPYEEPRYVVYFSVKRLVSSSADLMKVVSSAIGEIAKVMDLDGESTTEEVSKTIALSNYISSRVDQTVEDLKKIHLMPVVVGDGAYVTNQFPLQDAHVLEGSKIFILTNGSEYKMPDVVGWSTNEIIRYCNFVGLSYHLNGYGHVVSTNILKDTVLSFDTVLEIQLSTSND